VTRTYFDEKRFERFAGRVLRDASPLALGELRLEFADFQSGLRGDAVIRNPSLDSGFGRVDALTQIINALAVAGQREPANLVAVNASTSYPHLWLAPQLEFVQWNPIAASPLARNGGEVLGVFGVVKLDGPKEQWYTVAADPGAARARAMGRRSQAPEVGREGVRPHRSGSRRERTAAVPAALPRLS
jgi:hypothetical protein